MSEKPHIEELLAGDEFRDTMIVRADDKKNLLWHGWVIMDAFLAGVNWQKNRAKPVSEWQPIATAPRDGTPILGFLKYRDDSDEVEILTIRFHKPWGQWVMSGCLIGIQNNAKDDECRDPTHWKPLDPPPLMPTQEEEI